MARRRSGKKIDFTHWAYASASHLAFGAGTARTVLYAAQHLPETLLRFRGSLTAYIDGASAPGKLVSIGVGMILVPEGSAAVTWSPITDGDAPWIWASYFELGYEEMVVDVVDVPGLSSYREVVDSKAMRIVQNQDIEFVVENASIGSASSVNITFSGRGLFGT